MKKGLGRIPKSLSWINEIQEEKSFAKKHEKQPAEHMRITPSESLKSTQKGLPAGWTRATFIVDQQLNEKIKALAYWDRITVKDIVHDALKSYLKGRSIKPIPQRRTE